MDKDVQDAFKLLGNQITEGFVSVRQDMATKQDVESIHRDIESIHRDIESIHRDIESIHRDIESIQHNMATKQDVKDLEQRIRKIVREEVQDIRNDIEARCNPSPTE